MSVPAIAANVPALNSLPGAPATIYLSFVGDASNQSTPAYDTDGDPTTFTPQELANIQQIWAGEAEKYSPFNINVTTVAPTDGLVRLQAMEDLIGGNGAWTGSTLGGTSTQNGFLAYGSTANRISYVFSLNLANGTPRYVAECSSHEIGHQLGLSHHSLYDANGNFVQEYDPGNAQVAPIMGQSYYAQRGLWKYGQTDVPGTYQDDLAVIAGSVNGFGYRPWTAGQTFSTATPLNVSSGVLGVNAGVIVQKTDGGGNISSGSTDTYSFTTATTGPLTITINPAPYNGMLRGKLQLYNSSQGLIATAADAGTLGPTLNVSSLPGGAYVVVASSFGILGDCGQYSLTGQTADAAPAPPTPPPTPPMGTFLNDSFTDTAGTLLEAHTGETGATWTREAATSVSGEAQITASGTVRASQAAPTVYTASGTPPSPDYTVTGTLAVKSLRSGDTAGVVARAAGGAVDTLYGLVYSHGLGCFLFDRNAGASTAPLAGTSIYAVTAADGDVLALTVSGTTISGTINGVSIGSTTDATITGAGFGGIYFDGPTAPTDTAGVHLTSVSATSSTPSPTVTSVTVAPSTATVVGGTTQQFAASVAGTNSPGQTVTWSTSAGSITSGGLLTAPAATGSVQTVTVTATSTVDTSKSGTAAVTVPATTGSPTPTPTPTVTITPTAGNWSDNGYGTSTANYVQTSEFARLDVTTDATAVAVTAYTDAYAYPNITTIGYRVNGGAVQVLTCTAAGSSTFNVTLPGVAGTVVEFINGAQIIGGPYGWVGTYVTSLAFTGGTAATVVAPAAEPDKVLVYADSIAGGGNLPGTPPAAWPQQVRDTYGHVQVEAYGGRRLWNDCPTQSAAQAFAAHLAAQSPGKLISAIGINDKLTPGFPSLAAYTIAYGWMLDAFHALCPTVPVEVTSPLITNGSEGPNSQGDMLPAYRAAIAGLATGRPWLTVDDGSTILPTSEIGPNDVHPTAAGQVHLAAYYTARAQGMGATPTLTVSPSSIAAGSTTTVYAIGTNLTGRFTLGGTAGRQVSQIGPTAPGLANYTFQVTPAATGTLTLTDGSGGPTATVTVVPATPTTLAVVPHNASAVATWPAAAAATGYKLRRGGSVVYSGSALTYTDAGLTNGTAYGYTLSAVDAAGDETPQTSAVTVTPTVPTVAGGTVANPTPSDTVDLPFVGFLIPAFTGLVSVIPEGQSSPVSIAVQFGLPLNVRCTRVCATGTSNTSAGSIAILS